MIVSLFVRDATTERARSFIATHQPTPIVSNFGAAEFASALSIRLRTGRLDMTEARSAFFQFDDWRAVAVWSYELTSGDVRAADAFVRRLDLPLRAPDALHIAMARRLDCPLATFDARMADCGKILGVPLAPA